MIPYKHKLIRSRRKTIALQIDPSGTLIIRAPLDTPDALIHIYVDSKRQWIDTHLKAAPSRKTEPPFSRQQLQQLAKAAAEDLPRRAAKFAPLVGVTYNRITIRAQKSRWGSSSSLGNLNFNCLLMLAPESVRDYVVVHELCHQKQMNHSPKFWAEVARILPDYRKELAWLNKEGTALIARLKNTSG